MAKTSDSIHDTLRDSLGISTRSAGTTFQARSGKSLITITDDDSKSNNISADAKADYIFGFEGDDIISNSGNANVILVGGEGNDTFIIYNNSSKSEDGFIADFDIGKDKVDLSNFDISNYSDLKIVQTSSDTVNVSEAKSNLNLNLTVENGENVKSLNEKSFIFKEAIIKDPEAKTIEEEIRDDLGLGRASSEDTYNIKIDGKTSYTITDLTDNIDKTSIDSNTDYLFGFAGDDRLANDGNAEAILVGGIGNDIFYIYDNSSKSTDGFIADFEIGKDTINLTDFSVYDFTDLSISKYDSDTVIISHAESDLELNLTVEKGHDVLNLDKTSFSFKEEVVEEEEEEVVEEEEAVEEEEVVEEEEGDDNTDNIVNESASPTVNTSLDTIDLNPAPEFSLPSLREIDLNNLTNTIDGTAEDDVLQGSDTDESEIIYGRDGTDDIYGNSGNDILYGGDDIINPEDVADFLYGGVGSDIIFGNGGNDILIGGNDINDISIDGNDKLLGGEGNDIIFGNSGDDTLFGQTGDDTMVGGEGNDTFVFGFNTGKDLITSFESGDQLHILANINGSGIGTAADVIAATSFHNGWSSIDLGGGNIISIISTSSLSEADIQIVNETNIPLI